MVNKSVKLWTETTSKMVPKAQQPIFLGLESEKSGNQVPKIEIIKNHLNVATDFSLQIRSYTSPNELTRFQNKAKPIWVKIHCTNAVINQMVLQLFKLKTMKYGTF